MKTNLETLACERGLELITTVEGGNNGYPRGMRSAVIGFDSWEEAEELAKGNDLSLMCLHKRDGWQMWERLNSVYQPLQLSAEEYGDNYTQYSSEDYEDFYENEVTPFLQEFDNFDDLQKFIDKSKKVYEELSVIDDTQLVITFMGEYYETIDKESMSWYYDTHNYIIGVVDYED